MIHLNNPFKTMKKLKGIFIPLKLYFKFGLDKHVSYPFIYCSELHPIIIRSCDVGWKDKWDTPRFEYPPYIWIHLFGFNLIWWWSISNDDEYWEQALWYLYYYNTYSQGLLNEPDIKKAEESWPWEDYNTKKSSWNSNFLIKNENKL